MDFAKISELGKRIYNNKMLVKKDNEGQVVLSDEDAIKNLVDQTFTRDGEIKNMEQFRVFNKLIVETADTEANAEIEPILNLLADYQTVGRYDKVVYTVPKEARISLALTATGAGVDFKRIAPGSKKVPAKVETHQFGVYYNIDEMISDPVNKFREAVDYVTKYKVKYIFTKIMDLTNEAVTSGDIPSGQILDTAGFNIMDYRAIENRLLRYGRGVRPVMIADRNLIDSLAIKQANSGITGSEDIFLNDNLKESLLRETSITQISRTTAIPTVNPFVDNDNSKVDLPVDEGFVVAGGDKSPFKIREFGGMRTAQGLPDIEDERVNMKIDMKMDITLLLGRAMAYIQDAEVTL